MPSCRACGTMGSTDNWGRYTRNQRLKALCPECDRALEAHRQNTAAAREAGFACWSSTPEYKRKQREAEASRLGRAMSPYVSKRERIRIARLRRAEQYADKIRTEWAADWLSPFDLSLDELYWKDSEFREQKKAETRDRYWQRRDQQVARTRAYKTAHPDRVYIQHETRRGRIQEYSDGTATTQSIARLKHDATHCAYCGTVLLRKHTDHMIPLALGGAHSLRNIVIVCPDCNGRKASLSYREWTERVAPQHRPRVLAVFLERYRAMVA